MHGPSLPQVFHVDRSRREVLQLDQIRNGLRQQFVARVAEHLAGPRIHFEDRECTVGDGDAVRGVVEQGAILRLALAQDLLGPALLGDVEAGADDVLDVPVTIAHDRVRPGGEPPLPLFREPLVLAPRPALSGQHGLEAATDKLDALGRQEEIPDNPAFHLLETVAAQLLARRIESQDAALAIEDDHERSDHVEQRDQQRVVPPGVGGRWRGTARLGRRGRHRLLRRARGSGRSPGWAHEVGGSTGCVGDCPRVTGGRPLAGAALGLVEAAGIEPASESRSPGSPTGLSGRLDLARPRSDRRDQRRASPLLISSSALGPDFGPACDFLTPAPAPTGGVRAAVAASLS
jgi:hypothetical protein